MDYPSSFVGFLSVKLSKIPIFKRDVWTVAAVSMVEIMGRGKMRRSKKYSCFKCDQLAMMH
jgi:hypothetical protein